ncbi:MAG: ANTAR domain-containing protein [Firmicutes bacterium]|nr:ANTAR domain-containing protein [Bacillota bacterium]
MAWFIIAGGTEESRTSVKGLLSSAGLEVYQVCYSAGEVKRTFNRVQDAVLVLVGILPDSGIDDLCWDIGEGAHVLLIGRSALQERVSFPHIFRLEVPCTRQEILGACEMLEQLHRMSGPKRTYEEKALINDAKQILMQELHLPEDEAYQRMRNSAMNRHKKLIEIAQEILDRSAKG